MPPLERLTLGATGLWSPAHLTQARRLLAGRARKIRVLSDLELARAAAFSGGPGVILVCGTGSAAFGMEASGRRERAGGLGALLGDEGSGFWLGRALLRHEVLSRRLGLDALAFAHAPRPVRAVASLAPRLLALAARDRHARALRDEAAEHLAGFARSAAEGLRFPGPIPLSWTGSLFRDEAFLRAFLRAVSRSKKQRFAPAAPLLRPERAAAILDL